VLILQPTSKFGQLVCEQLASKHEGEREWSSFECAVAWVNKSGADCIMRSAKQFLAEGGRIRSTVGLDFGSTTYEGLLSLLDLETQGSDIATHVYHDENWACTFHPKVFLFSNKARGRLYVGSNNVTGGGLDTNIEATLEVSGPLGEETFRAANKALADWRDDSNDKKSRRLTRKFLDELRDQGYVLTETELRERRNVERKRKTRVSERRALFGRSETPASGVVRKGRGSPAVAAKPSVPSGDEVLLMRVRPRRTGGQLQISIPVHEGFMKSAKEVISLNDGSSRSIGYNYAREKRNTARFEAPEMLDMKSPVAQFQWLDSPDGGGSKLHVRLFDAAKGGRGAEILKKLEEGIGTPPATLHRYDPGRDQTILSTADKESAQWYRMDGI
jgi:HKD family nuclease